MSKAREIVVDGWTVEVVPDVDGSLFVYVSAGDRVVIADGADIAVDYREWGDRFEAVDDSFAVDG